MESENTKNTSDQKHIATTFYSTDDNGEIRVIARESFFKLNAEGKKELSLTPAEDGHGIKNEPGDIAITLNRSKLQSLLSSGQIEPEDFNAIIGILENQNKPKELINTSAKTEAKKFMTGALAIRKLISLSEILNDKNLTKTETAFKDKKGKIDSSSFGFVKALADRLYYLPNLIENAGVYPPKEGSSTYKIKSTFKTGNMGEIGLEHNIRLNKENKTVSSSFDDQLRKSFDSFTLVMKGEALKIYLAYQAYAYSKGSFFVGLTPMIDIMKLTLKKPRKGSFSSSEKCRFFDLSELLEETYITITLAINGEEVTHKQQLLRLGPSTGSKTRGYPDKISYRVLDTETFSPDNLERLTEISKTILSLPFEDVLLALSFEIRKKQREGAQFMTYGSDAITKRGGTSATHTANPRQEKVRREEKLKRIQKAGIIEDFTESDGKYLIEKKVKIKSKKKCPKT